MKVSVWLVFIILLFQFVATMAQLSQPIEPVSNLNPSWNTFIQSQYYQELEQVDIAELIKEDAITDQHKDIAWRFGVAIPCNYDISNSGQELFDEDGNLYWTLKIRSQDALSLNLNFERFQIPDGAYLHIYDENKNSILGAFTSLNNRSDSLFATTVIRGEEVILEYFEPYTASFKGVIKLKSVVHGYRSIAKRAENFEGSGSCNINVNCPEGNAWQNEKRAVAMILLANNTRICTGILVNNARQDGTPYFLTANHCSMNATNVFIFNYDSPGCSNTSEPSLSDAITGCNILSNGSSFYSSDFLLARLSSPPPASFNAYYAGWSKIDEGSKSSVCIHHPRGDVKKISVDLDRAVSSGYYSKGNDHWAVQNWERGTTEDGSSGAPLFNEQHRVVGQLHGGEASCSSDSVDFYGKFSHSWDTESDTSKQLKYWLDPDDSGIEIVDGYDPNAGPISLDAQMASLGINNNSVCSDSIFPELIIKNLGNSTLTSLKVEYYLDGSPIGNQNWTGSLATNQINKIQLPGIAINTGNHRFTATCSLPNGGTDGYNLNNSLSRDFFSIDNPTEIELILKTDDFGNETKWELTNAVGTIIESYGNYPGINGGKTYTHKICLYAGCYEYHIFDTWGDGFCCGTGNGSYEIKNLSTGVTIDFNNTFSDFADTTAFCVGDSCTILVSAQIKSMSEVNANDGAIDIKVTAGNPPFIYSWSNGSTTASIDSLSIGIYTLTVTDALGCTTQFDFEVKLSTGIERPKKLNDLKIYPNPSNGMFTVEFKGEVEAEQIVIYNLSGQEVFSTTIQSKNNMLQLDLRKLIKGAYLFTAIGQKQRYTTKLLISN